MTGKTPRLGLSLPVFDQTPWHDLVNANFSSIDALFYSTFGITSYRGPYVNSTAVNENDKYYDVTSGVVYRAVTSFVTMPKPNSFATERATYPSRWESLETTSLNPAATAQAWADNPYNSEVMPGHYSALHHATIAANAQTVASNAATVASNALATFQSSCSAFALTVLDDTNASAMLTTLGATTLGKSLFTAANMSAALTTIGAQPVSAGLTSLASIGTVAGKIPYATAPNTWGEFTTTSFSRSFLGTPTAAAARDAMYVGEFTPIATQITSWDAIDISGLYMGNALADAPDATNWYIGWHQKHNSLYAVQEVICFNLGSATNSMRYRRYKRATWTVWERCYDSIAEINGLISAITPGIGQTWQDVLASRAVSTTYQNTTGKEISVNIRLNGGNVWVQVSANTVAWVNVANSGQNSEYLSVSFRVPNGWYYRINGGVSGLSMWSELR